MKRNKAKPRAPLRRQRVHLPGDTRATDQVRALPAAEDVSLEAVVGLATVSHATMVAQPGEIAAAVVEDIAELSNYAASQISGAFVLTGPPLLFTDFGLTALAQRLWKLIKSQNAQGYITIAEVRTQSLTVGALVKLVISRC